MPMVYVQINKAKSKTQLIEYGVPKWSILGPLLFIFCINNLNKTLQNAYCVIFADDTKIRFKKPLSFIKI